MLTSTQIKTFIEAGMLADAFGVPYEFKSRDSFTATTMIGHGTYDMPIGSWSDDSSLTLILMQTMLEDKQYATFMHHAEDYMMHGAFTPNGEMFDIGATTRKAVINFAEGAAPLASGDRSEYANGNGGIMRVAPLAVTLLHEKDTAVRQATIENWTKLTHSHERSLVGSFIYVEFLRQCLLGSDLTEALCTVQAELEQTNYTPSEVALFDQIFAPDFAKTPRASIASSGYVVDSLLAAVWLNFHADDYESLILTAVNLGSDTDTIAQLAAHLFAATHHNLVLPRKWLQQLIMPDDIQHLINQFAQAYVAR